MDQVGGRWTRLVIDGQGWCAMDQVGARWTRLVLDGPGWC